MNKTYTYIYFFILLSLFLGVNKLSHSQSILESGQWYKVQVSETGLYKLTYEDFENMGFDVSNLDPQHIRVFGNIEGVLPEANKKMVPDALIENSIFVSGAQDGSFDSEDYVVFYGKSAHDWHYDSQAKAFKYHIHPYHDFNYYYIGINGETGKRIEQKNSLTDSPDYTISSFLDHQKHEVNLINFIKSGREWFGEFFDDYNNSLDLTFVFPNIITTKKVKYELHIAARTRSHSTIKTSLNGGNGNNFFVPRLGASNHEYAAEGFDSDSLQTNSDTLNFNLEYSKPNANSNVWLNYFVVNAYRELRMSQHQLPFNSLWLRNNRIAKYELSDATESIKIWDITDPYNISQINGGTLANGTLEFSITTSLNNFFIAFDSEEFYTPTLISEVENQNLKELTGFDMVIVTIDDFIEEAQRIADFHHEKDQLNVLITTTDKIYNEFSSGKTDPTAIRNFLRYHYNHAEDNDKRPEYLLLFGDASYDFKDVLDENTNLVPVYQSKGSVNTTKTYDTDDYFGIMGQMDGDSSFGEIQIAIGRFPVHTIEQAKIMVDKTLHYASNFSNQMKNWRNKVSFIADDEDNNLHLDNSDKLADTFLIEHPEFNIEKIYLDNYVRLSTPSGYRYPDVTNAINNSINDGLLFFNYTGHGGHLALTDERVMQIPDIQSWTNIDHLTVFIIASCEFGPFDNPHHISAGEHVVLNPRGGGVALFTTTRLAYASYNFKLNKKFHEIAFSRKENGSHYNLGEIIKYAKNESGNKKRNLNFCLLGDPAIKMAYPEYHVETTHINDHPVSSGIKDTIKARQTVTVKAQVTDLEHHIVPNFSGKIQVCVYGQPSIYTTLANSSHSHKTDVSVIDMLIYKGKVKAKNGKFEFSFVVPDGINSEYDKGKISYYATQVEQKDNQEFDANGGFIDFIIGGVDESIDEDITGPEINAFMEDRSFINGDFVSSNPVMLIDLFDESGINNVELGFGRDIVAKLDSEQDLVLNDYYVNDLDDFRKGSIEFKYNDLDFGEHELTIKAWDMFNNSSEKTLSFVVIANNDITIDHLQNKPNPFKDFTNITFNHNQLDEKELFVTIKIYNIRGQEVYELNETVAVIGNGIEPIVLNSDTMNLNNSGLYSYIIQVKNKEGKIVQQKQKIIVIK